MADEKQPKKVARYRITKGKNGIEFPGFRETVTEALLNGPRGAAIINSLQRYEAERELKIFGTLIVLD